MSFRKITAEEWQLNPFEQIGRQWMLVAAEKEGRVNAMTASWGGVGVLWNKNVAFIFLRRSRFTKTLVDAADTFSLTFFDRPRYDGMLAYMGKASGRNEDKIAAAGLDVVHEGNTPYFAQANTVLLCRKLSRHPFAAENFIDPSIEKTWYADGDYHDLYVAEITGILEA